MEKFLVLSSEIKDGKTIQRNLKITKYNYGEDSKELSIDSSKLFFLQGQVNGPLSYSKLTDLLKYSVNGEFSGKIIDLYKFKNIFCFINKKAKTLKPCFPSLICKTDVVMGPIVFGRINKQRIVGLTDKQIKRLLYLFSDMPQILIRKL